MWACVPWPDFSSCFCGPEYTTNAIGTAIGNPIETDAIGYRVGLAWAIAGIIFAIGYREIPAIAYRWGYRD